MNKNVEKLECIQCGYCCGYRRNSHFGGCSYPDGTRIPVDKNDVCIHLEVLDNGFAKCGIHEKRPQMCRLYYCIMEQKIRSLKTIINHLEKKREERDELVLSQILKSQEI